MVEGTGLENRRTGNGIVSSNLTLSAAAVRCRCDMSDTSRWLMQDQARAVVDPRVGAFVLGL